MTHWKCDSDGLHMKHKAKFGNKTAGICLKTLDDDETCELSSEDVE